MRFIATIQKKATRENAKIAEEKYKDVQAAYNQALTYLSGGFSFWDILKRKLIIAAIAGLTVAVLYLIKLRYPISSQRRPLYSERPAIFFIIQGVAMKHFIKRSPSRLFLTISLLTLSVVLFALRTASAQDANPFPFEKDVQRYEQISAENPPSSDNTFFVGSSTFTIWKEIPEDFAEYKAINRGFGGSQISHWLDVAAERILKPYKPRRIVFFCGCNDIASGKSPEEVFENFQAFVEMMRDANPNVVIHFCALHMPPVREKHWENFRKLNADVEALAEKIRIFTTSISLALPDENGAESRNFFKTTVSTLLVKAKKSWSPSLRNRLKEKSAISAAKERLGIRLLSKTSFAKGTLAQRRDLELPSQVPVKHKLGNWTVAFDRENDASL